MFQYPRVDRLICGDLHQSNAYVGCRCFSILVWIDLFVGQQRQQQTRARAVFQYPRVDRLICGDWLDVVGRVGRIMFQYPRVDRLICGERSSSTFISASSAFQYPRVDRLICGAGFVVRYILGRQCFSILVWIDLFVGRSTPSRRAPLPTVSVSSCGSTYLWGSQHWRPACLSVGFSILVWIDLFVGRIRLAVVKTFLTCFSILVWIDLFVGGTQRGIRLSLVMFQYPRVDRLICGAPRRWKTRRATICFSILVWIDLFVGLPHRPDRRSAPAVSVSSCGSTYLWG